MEFTIKIGDFYVNKIYINAFHPECSFITDFDFTYNVDLSMRLDSLGKAESLKDIIIKRFNIPEK